MARRSAVALWREEEVPEDYVRLLSDLADVLRFMASELLDRHLPVAARPRLLVLSEATSHLDLHESMSAVVILAQLRSMIVDFLQLTGLDYAEARNAMPDMD
jgi:hypothetical protein